MKRHVHLQTLSRQHHNGLLIALLVNKGLKKNARLITICEFIHYNWQQDLQEHFRLEEEILIPALANKPFDSSLTDRLLQEHTEISELVNRLTSPVPEIKDVERFSHLLEQHIRFEERVYFPAAEKVLTEQELEQVGALLHDKEEHNCITYPVKFWE